MRLTHLALCASIAALGACSDAPVTQPEATADAYSMAGVTVMTPADYAARGLALPAMPSPMRPALLIQPLEPCYDYNCPPEEPTTLPIARIDYFSSSTKEYEGSNKKLTLWSKQEAHNNMESMVLRATYYSVGAQEWKGCGATPAQFSSDYLVKLGAPTRIDAFRTMTYSQYSAFVWRIKVDHTWTANYGWSIDGYNRQRTYPSGHTVCW
jgi:hypothetical protein